MYIGIDLGTSSVKTLLIDETQRVLASVLNRPLLLPEDGSRYRERFLHNPLSRRHRRRNLPGPALVAHYAEGYA